MVNSHNTEDQIDWKIREIVEYVVKTSDDDVVVISDTEDVVSCLDDVTVLVNASLTDIKDDIRAMYMTCQIL